MSGNNITSPLAIDLFCGLGGWTEGLLSENWRVIGFDIERHEYGDEKYPAQLVLQDVLTLHGKQFKDAALIVASPPCQEFSYMAMPWSKAKEKARAIRASVDEQRRLTTLFDACFRIQREACEAADRHIPLVVENVKGAQPWVGRARWMFGSFALWGDVPALMPMTTGRQVMKNGVTHRANGETNFHGYKSTGLNWSDRSKRGQDFTRVVGAQADGTKGNGGSWFYANKSGARALSLKGKARKRASAMIAKIPLPLSRYIARTFKPIDLEIAA